jgi:hypothetical protein
MNMINIWWIIKTSHTYKYNIFINSLFEFKIIAPHEMLVVKFQIIIYFKFQILYNKFFISFINIR